jgi:hypothetical protein
MWTNQHALLFRVCLYLKEAVAKQSSPGFKPRTFWTQFGRGPLFAALRSPEDLLSPAWPRVAGAESRQRAGGGGGGGLSCLFLPRLMTALPGPGVVTAPPASELPVLASSVHLHTHPLARQLHLRNNGNLDNFPKSVIMSFGILSFSFLKFYCGLLLNFFRLLVWVRKRNFWLSSFIL